MEHMTSVYVTVNRAECIRRGINGTDTPVLVDLDVSTMDEDDRADVARRLDLKPITGTYGAPSWPAPRLCSAVENGGLHDAPLIVVEPTQDGVIAALRVDRDRAEKFAADKAAKEDASRLAAAAIDSAVIAADMTGIKIADRSDRRVKLDSTTFGDFRSSWIDAHEIAAAAAKIRDRVAKVAADKAAKEAERRQKEDERRQWIVRHGSPRLATMVAEGIACEVTFAEERDAWEQGRFEALLVASHPQWVEVNPDTVDYDVSDVPTSAIEILKAGRAMFATCRLAIVAGEYVCVADFEGRVIMWPTD